MLRFLSLFSRAFFFAPEDGGGEGAGGAGTGEGAGGAGDAGAAGGSGGSSGAADESQLGDAGKRALDAERLARSNAEKAAREAAEKSAALEAELTKFREANQSDTEKAIAKAREEADKAARDEVESKYEQRLLESNVLVRAAGKLADPSDAVKLIDLAGLEKTATGEIEDKTIDAAIAALVKQKPYLASGAKPGPGSADGGPRGDRPAQLTQADLKGMTPEAIVEAKAKGQLDGVLGRS